MRRHCVRLAASLALLTALPAASCASEPPAAAPFTFEDPHMPPFTLPDALTTAAGRKIATAEEWRTIRRPEVLELFRQHVYGRVPARPVQVTFKVQQKDPQALGGAATLKLVDIAVACDSKRLKFRVVLFTPNSARGPAPAFLLICNREPTNIDPTRKVKSPFWPVEEAVARGYAMAAFHNEEVDPDRKDGFNDGVRGLFGSESRKPDAWGALAAWAWGASRVMDYFETDPDVARNQVAVLGHSRGGKTALWAGAQDERFALVISNESGCGGASLSRRRFPERESVERINTQFPFWFCENFRVFNNREDALPVDQHLLLALIAPRAVYVASAAEDLWADPRGEFLSLVHAQPVYQLLGKKGLGTSAMPAVGQPLHGDGAAYHIREGKHGLTLYDWQRYLDFADRVFGRGR